MGLFLKQTEQRTQLQEKIAADLANRTKPVGSGDNNDDVGTGILEESQQATSRSVFWVGVVTMLIVAAAVFVLFIFSS